ncbi:helix-turn-helix domain-containing protein [Streptomyces sp. NBC_01351]|uniref:helix-turn-helix domain-containing protein n=1 Tax=Streptomyces sp. NBC_01351 TaxID=2903833 RepID=UPI002E34C4E2|nr:helix-turn-helix domain-containing protein [Streptomyces sp. NBC_01351]
MTQSVETTSASDAERSLPSPKERRRLREAADLTHDEVAAAVGVTPTTVRSWETGRTAPRGRKREVYARFLTRLQTPADTPPGAAAPHANTPAGPESDAPASTPAGPPSAPRTHTLAGPEAPAPAAAASSTTPAEPAATAAAPARADSAAAHADTPVRPEAIAPPEAAPRSAADAGSPATPASGLRATGAVRDFAGVGAGAGAGAGTRPEAAAKQAAKPPAGAVRHTAEPPVPVAPGGYPESPGTAAPTHAPAEPNEPDRRSAPSKTAASAGTAAAPATDDRQPAATPGTAGTTMATTAEAPQADADPATDPDPDPDPDQATPQAPRHRTPVQDFDALHAHAAPALTRQTYLLTGRRALAQEAVERAFQQAWERWPEVATDPDPVGWVRAAAYEYALSPWHLFRRAHRHPDKPPAEPADRILLDAMLALPTNHRRTVLLYDGVGLDLPDTAAETEASTPTAGNRLLHAHATLAERIPELADVAPEKQSALLRDRFTALRPAVALDPRPAAVVRDSGERRTRLWTRVAVGVTAVIAVATAFTAATAPTKYEPPNAPGANVSGVPPHSGPQRLTEESRTLHDKLRSDPDAGPARIVPKGE